jgi:hypothetical protein
MMPRPSSDGINPIDGSASSGNYGHHPNNSSNNHNNNSNNYQHSSYTDRSARPTSHSQQQMTQQQQQQQAYGYHEDIMMQRYAMGGGNISGVGGNNSMMEPSYASMMGGAGTTQQNLGYPQQQQHQQQQQQQQHYRHDMSIPSPNMHATNYPMMPGEVSPRMAQQQPRISTHHHPYGTGTGMSGGGAGAGFAMNASNSHPSQYYNQMGNTSNFPPPVLDETVVSRGSMPGTGGSHLGRSGATGNTSSTTGGPNVGAQADREEELLLQLLIARRQRGHIVGEKGRSTQSLADELMRLRQGRAAAARSGTLPGMSSLYENPTGASSASTGPYSVSHNTAGAYPSHHPAMLSYDPYGRKSITDVAMNLPTHASILQDAAERIDRSPTRMMDARTQEMRDFSGRGFKRGYENMGGAFKYQMQMEMPGMGMHNQPVKKKRTHKKKPADMPRRPLSAYNLFFSEERERILKEIDDTKEGGDEIKKEDTEEGKEDGTVKEANKEEEPKADEPLSKPKALMRPMIPAQKKRRPHRKTHGKISFQHLARMVGERWKSLDEDRRKYYQELAQEDMKRQKAAMEAYYAKQNAAKGGNIEGETGTSMGTPEDEVRQRTVDTEG